MTRVHFLAALLVATAPALAAEPAALKGEGLKVTATPKDGAAKIATVQADGTILLDGKPLGSFQKNELRDRTGKIIYSVDAAGKLLITGSSKKAQFNTSDDLETDDRSVIAITKEGEGTLTKKGGLSLRAELKVEGLTRQNRRAAVLLVTYLLTGVERLAPPPAAK